MSLNEKFDALLSEITDKKYILLLSALACVTFLGALDARSLTGGDETRVAGIGAEIALKGNWIVPKLNGTPFLEYPPLYYILDAMAFRIFGINDFAAKLPSVLGAILSLTAVYGIVRRFRWEPFYAFLSALMLMFSAQFYSNARTCMVDGLLAGFVAFAVWMFLECDSEKKYVWKKLLWFLGFVLSAAGAVFTKGLIGLVFPCAMLGSWMLLNDILEKKFTFSRYAFLGIGSVLALLPVAGWVYLLYREAGAEAVHTVVIVNNLGRFTGSQGDHVLPWYYYLLKLPGQFQPWTILLPFALWHHIRNVIRKQNAERSLFLLCALLVPYLLLTLSAGKRQVYLLPLYAMEAGLIGTMVADYLTGKSTLPFRIPSWKKIPDVLLLCTAFGFLAVGIVFCFMAPLRLFLFPVLVVLAGLILMTLRGETKSFHRILTILFGIALVLAAVDAGPMRNRDGKDSYQLKFDRIRGDQLRTGGRIFLEKPPERVRGAVVYFLHQIVPEHVENPKKGDIIIRYVKREVEWEIVP